MLSYQHNHIGNVYIKYLNNQLRWSENVKLATTPSSKLF